MIITWVDRRNARTTPNDSRLPTVDKVDFSVTKFQDQINFLKHMVVQTLIIIYGTTFKPIKSDRTEPLSL